MKPDHALAITLADEADMMTMARYRALDLHIETKPDNTPVTEADQAVERMIREALSVERPDDGIIGEEFADTDTGRSRLWVIDPIDATKNYVRGVPVWGTLIALVVDGDPLVGMISAPALGRRWWAVRREGAFTRDVDGTVRQIHVSGVKNMSDASFSYSDHVGWDKHGNGKGFENLRSSVWRTRAYGDFWSHLMVAEGSVDIAAEPELNNFDMAAFVAVVIEAGGTVTGFDGSAPLDAGNALTTNGALHSEALALIAR